MFIFFFFNDTATTEIYTLSLHDALPISPITIEEASNMSPTPSGEIWLRNTRPFNAYGLPTISIPCGIEIDRKSTRLNSSHSQISYAVFCLKKKKKAGSSGGKQSGTCYSL